MGCQRCVGSWGQGTRHKGKARPDSGKGLWAGRAGHKHSSAFFLSAFPRQQRNRLPALCMGLRGKGDALGQPLPWPHSDPTDTVLSLDGTRWPPSPWLSWESVGFKRLILGDFIFRAKRKETARPDGAGDAHGLCKPPLTQVLIRSSAQEPGWRGCTRP